MNAQEFLKTLEENDYFDEECTIIPRIEFINLSTMTGYHADWFSLDAIGLIHTELGIPNLVLHLKEYDEANEPRLQSIKLVLRNLTNNRTELNDLELIANGQEFEICELHNVEMSDRTFSFSMKEVELMESKHPTKMYSPDSKPVIAIDLDGTVWKSTKEDGSDIFPEPGEPFENAIKTINAMIIAGYEIIIWTARDYAEQAMQCKKRLLERGLNPNFKWNWYSNYSNASYIVDKTSSKKVDADVFIDDKAYGAPIYSEEVWATIFTEFIGGNL